MAATTALTDSAWGLVQALLIGLIVGAQREAAQDEQQPGLRDFLLIALTGGICGVVQNSWLTTTALAAIAALLAVFHWRAEKRTGITTELAAVATFSIAMLAATPGELVASKLAVGAAIVVVAFLEAKRALHRLVRETITETEFIDTLWFLAVIFIIYPLLPEGEFGPYEGLAPRRIWVFVILVSSISFVGYFFQKFLGKRRGLVWTSILGGLASTTAATLAFARRVREEPEETGAYWYGAVVANAIQFPRILVILYVMNPRLALATSAVLAAMTAAGLTMGILLYRRSGAGKEARGGRFQPGNPFRLGPALRFGAVFAVIVLLSKAATAEFGDQGLYWASAAGGTMDADAVAVAAADMLGAGATDVETARLVLLVALLMNAVLKTGLAVYEAGGAFGRRVGSGFAVMFAAGALALAALGWI